MRAFDQDVGFTRSADGVRLASAVHDSGFRLVRADRFILRPMTSSRAKLCAAWLAADGNAIDIVQRGPGQEV